MEIDEQQTVELHCVVEVHADVQFNFILEAELIDRVFHNLPEKLKFVVELVIDSGPGESALKCKLGHTQCAKAVPAKHDLGSMHDSRPRLPRPGSPTHACGMCQGA